MVARWTLDAKAGRKKELVGLLNEWITSVAVVAGLEVSCARVLNHAVGGVESRLELELEVESLSAYEQLMANLPPSHAVWAAKLSSVVVDASTSWTILRVLEVAQPAGEVLPAASVAVTHTRTKGGLYVPVDVEAEAREVEVRAAVVLDWKGDPMILNAGDRLPRFG